MRTACLLPVSPSMYCSRGGGGVPARGGVPAQGVAGPGGVPGPRGVPAWGVYLVRGACTWSGGVYLVQGCTWSMGCTWSGGCTWSWEVYLPGGVPAWGVPTQVLPLWTEWQTGVKILPCPKLRLRAVIIWPVGKKINPENIDFVFLTPCPMFLDPLLTKLISIDSLLHYILLPYKKSHAHVWCVCFTLDSCTFLLFISQRTWQELWMCQEGLFSLHSLPIRCLLWVLWKSIWCVQKIKPG